MPRTKRSPVKPNNNIASRGSTAGDNTIVWVNVRLDQDDLDTLERSAADLEHIGAMLLSIVDRGYSFSVKRMADGESIMCAITGITSDGSNRQVGVSAFAATAGDASLCCLYKFEQKLGGIFTGDTLDSAAVRPRFR